MDYSAHTTAEGQEVALSGRFTYADHQSFRDFVATFPALSGRKLVLDLGGLEFVDSAAMGMLLLARETAVQQKIDTVLRNPSGRVRDLLKVARFDTLFRIE